MDLEYPLISEMEKYGVVEEKKFPRDFILFGGMLYRRCFFNEEDYDEEE